MMIPNLHSTQVGYGVFSPQVVFFMLYSPIILLKKSIVAMKATIDFYSVGYQPLYRFN